MDIAKVPKDMTQDFYERDKRYVQEYLANKNNYDSTLGRINIFIPEFWNDSLIDESQPLLIQKVVYNRESDHRSFYIIEQEAKRYGMTLEDIYGSINEAGFRSQPFYDIGPGKRILFAGCSVTFGHGLPEEYIWPKIVYNEIAKHESVAGYYNIAKVGASRMEILLLINDYIRVYGVPDIILINMPDSQRDFIDDEGFHNTKVSLAVRALYELTRDLVHEKGGTLLSCSWSSEDMLYNIEETPSSLASLSTHIKFTNNDFLKHLFDFTESNPNHPLKEYVHKSMDLAHPGLAEHSFYAKLFLQSLDM